MRFVKYHGLGHDFIVLETDHAITPELAVRLCARGFSVGADGLMRVAPPSTPEADVRMDLVNSDGSLPEMCGRICPQDRLCEGNCVIEKGFDSVVAAHHKLATDRGNPVVALSEAELARWVKATADVDDQWIKEVNAKGANGNALIDAARALIQKHDR